MTLTSTSVSVLLDIMATTAKIVSIEHCCHTIYFSKKRFVKKSSERNHLAYKVMKCFSPVVFVILADFFAVTCYLTRILLF